MAWRARDPERSGEPVVTQLMLCHVFHADCTAAVCCDTTRVSEECENQGRVQAEEESTGNIPDLTISMMAWLAIGRCICAGTSCKRGIVQSGECLELDAVAPHAG